MPTSLGLDLSTQSCSAVLIDTAGLQVVAEESVNFGADLPQYKAPSGFIPDGENGEVHSDPRMWLDALELLLERLGKKADLSEVAAISGAGQQHGTVYLNAGWLDAVSSLSASNSLTEQLEPCLSRNTSPIWMDNSTAEQCKEIAAALGGDQEVCARSGSVAIERFSGPQIRRFFQTASDAYEGTARIHLVSSFFCSILCGVDAPIDTGDGAGMNLLNIGSGDWDQGLLEATAPGLRERLPEVKGGHAWSGSLSSYFVEKYGFKAQVPVSLFTGDNPSSLVGMGASRPGKLVISLGTSDTFFAAMPEVCSDPDGCGHVFGNPMGGTMSLQCFVNGSLAREATKDRFEMDWDAFTEALEQTEPGNEGKVMLPFYRPEISPRFESESPILRGGSAFENWEEPQACIRACVEGQFINMRRCSRWMNLAVDEIYLTGGASNNDAIAQVVADVFQARVERLEVSGSVGLGAAMRAACHELGIPMADLEAAFCKPRANATVLPQAAADTYEAHDKRFGELLS